MLGLARGIGSLDGDVFDDEADDACAVHMLQHCRPLYADIIEDFFSMTDLNVGGVVVKVSWRR